MAQIFHPSTNTLSKASIFGAIFIVAGAIWAVTELDRSAYVTQGDVARDQPVPFSHKHHVAGLGLDCRTCHTTVEVAAFAGIPPTQTCMSCHSQIWADSPMLEPVRASLRTGVSLEWTRVHDLPDFVYFDHSIHVKKGMGCSTCHGRVDQMPLMRRENTLHMDWCLDCHRQPERFVRPRERVYDMTWTSPPDQLAQGQRLVAEYMIKKLTDCSVCHR